MRASADPSGQSPMRRLAILGLVFVAAILSCGKDVTGPLSAAGRFVRGFSWEPIFPAVFQAAGGGSSGLVQFNRVHVVLHHSDGTVALDTTIDFPAGADSLTLELTVKLLNDAPASGEPMTLSLGYLNAAGDTVFKGGPVSLIAAPPPAGGGSNPPVKIPVSYTGPGSSATSVVISPRSGTVVSGSGFSFSAIAKDINGVTLAGTPIIWNSLDPSIATITSAAAGNGLAQNQRGTARIIAQLLTGPADTVQLFVLLPATQIIAQSGNAQTGVAGTQLAQPLVVKVAATDGVGVAGVTVNFAVATGGGSVANTSVVSDANGLAQTTFRLGTGTGAQSVTASAGSLTNSPLTFTATAQAAAATKLVVTTQPVNGVAGIALTPVVFTAEDNNGNIATTFTGPVVVAFGANGAGATLGGTTTVNAVAGVATFSTLTVNKNGSGYNLVASSTGLTSATTNAFDIVVGAPNKLVFTVQPAGAIANVAMTPAIVVNAQDSQGNPTPAFTGAVALGFATNPTGATLGGTLTVNAVAGAATFAGISVSTSGSGYALSASATGLTSATSATFITGGGVATTIAVASGAGQTGPASTALALPVVIQVTDAGANPVAGTTVNFAVLTGGGSVAPPSGVTNAAGQVQTTWTLGALIGAQTVRAASAGLAGSPLTISATATVSTANKTWTGATNNLWATTTNWSPAGVPATTDSVFIPVTANNPQLATNATVEDLYIASGATLTLGSDVTLVDNGTLDATGGILGTGNVMLGGAVPRNIKGSVTAGSVSLVGAYTQNGSFIVVGNLVNNSGGSLIMNGNTTSVTGNFSTAGTGTLTMNNAADALTVTGNVTFGGGNETGLLTAGNLFVTGNFTQASGSTSFIAAAAHTTKLNGTAAQTVNFANPFPSTFGAVVFANTAGVTLQTNMISNGAVTVSAGAVSGTAFGFTIGGTLTDPGALLAVASISFTGSTTPVAATTPTINASVTFNNNPSILAGNLTVNGAVNVDGNLQLNSHYLVVNGTFGTLVAGQLTMTNAADSMSVTGTATFGGGSTGGILTNGKLKLAGSFAQVNNGSGQEFAAAAGHTTLFTGINPTVSFANPTTSSFGKAQLQVSTSMTFSTDVRFMGDVWLKTGSTPSVTNAGGTVTIGGALYDTTGGRWQVANTTMSGAGPLPRSLNTNLTIGGALTLTDSLKLTGAANNLSIGAGSLTLGGHYVSVPGTFSTAGTGTFVMTSANDSLMVTGNATFSGGATTGLLTNGTLVVGGSSISVTGLAIDASGSHTTTLNGTTGTQTLSWTTPTAGKGYNNLTLRGAAQRQFSGDQSVAGNMLIALGSGNVNGSYNLTFAGNITDSTVAHNAWNGSSLVKLTGSPTVLPRNFGVNTLQFLGGTVTLADTLNNVGNIVVDGASSHLKLNGHYVHTSSNFTTQNGGVLEMTNTHDSLVVLGTVTFNGGNTSTLLSHGYMNIAGFSQGVNATAFVADSTLRVSIGQGGASQITFANPGFGPTLSHFGELMIGDGSTHTLNSNVFVEGQITTNAGVRFPVTSANLLITARGANATHLFLTNTRLLLLDGSPVTTLTDLQFSSMDPTLTQFEVQRSGTAGSGDFAATLSVPVLNTTPTSGLYLKATDTDGSTPFLTINTSSPTPAANGGFIAQLSGAVINNWPSAGPATHLVFSTPPVTTVAGANITPAIVVQAKDAGNALATTFTGNVTLAIGTNPGTSTLSGSVTVAAAAGVATFNNISLNKVGTGYTLTAAATGLTGATSSTFNVTAAAAATLAINAGNAQTGGVNTALGSPISALVTDAFGNPVSGVNVTFAVGTGGGSVGTQPVASNASGIASTTWTLGVAGANSVTATASGLSGSPLTFSATAVAFASLSVNTAGGTSTCALSTAGAAYCWGDNTYGQLGDNTTTQRKTPTPVAGGLVFTSLTAGLYHTCGLTTAGAAYCWGNNNGQLGDGTTTQRLTPVAVSQGGLVFASLTAGIYHTCGVTTGNAAYCWGNNIDGQLGDGTTTNHFTPTAVTGSHSFTSLAANQYHTCGVTTGSVAYCWGDNSFGQLGDTTTTQRLSPTLVAGGLALTSLTSGGLWTCGLTAAGTAYCWGYNATGVLGDGTTTQRLSPVAVSQGGLVFSSLTADTSTCGLTTTGGAAYCWGDNSFGQLGDGTTTQRLAPTLITGGLAFSSVTAGSVFTCGLTTGSAMYCWGSNANGELGDGTTNGHLVPNLVIP
jgi:alpha-tubulin suppressor-like RCC1 family protein